MWHRSTLAIALISCVGCVFWIRRYNRIPTIFVITPTYARTNQQADLVRLCTVFNYVGNIYWIVVEDSNTTSPKLEHFLKECGVPFMHLNRASSKYIINVRGARQRNTALRWLRKTYRNERTSSVVYFGDDDNTYHPQLFREMRYIKRGGTWPVGYIANSDWEGCITDQFNPNKISGFWTRWKLTRKFPIDMAGFAVRLDVVLGHPNALFDEKAAGLQEGDILGKLDFENAYELEPKANGCTKILVWHTKAVKPNVRVRGPETIVEAF